MTTLYQQKATIATPAAHIQDANQIALALGESAADDQTFSTASYQDAFGNLYAVASTVTNPIFAQMAGQPLKAPDHAPKWIWQRLHAHRHCYRSTAALLHRTLSR